jgi:threonine/homoserine/homoserine lactone efflux protein
MSRKIRKKTITLIQSTAIVAGMTETAVLVPYLVFCVLMTGTPGPNNTMALAAGVKVGFWRSLPLVCGIAIGVGVQLIAIGLGLGAALAAFPTLHNLLRIGGAMYLLWLALKIARSGPIRSDNSDRPPIGFLSAAAFQWINPKAWALTTSAVAAYVPAADYTFNIAVAAILMALIAVPCVAVWAAGGTVLRPLLMESRYARAFNVVVALLLVSTTISIMIGD